MLQSMSQQLAYGVEQGVNEVKISFENHCDRGMSLFIRTRNIATSITTNGFTEKAAAAAPEVPLCCIT